MINDKIDLYEYFNISHLRGEKTKGYLTTYVFDKYWQKPDRKRPAVLICAGGGYAYVADREAEPIALTFLSKGYSAFSLEYSTQPISYPYPILEAVMAIIFIRENAEKYAVDVSHVASVGFSAGGHLAGSVAIIPDEPEIVEILGDRALNARPNATVLSYPVITSGEFAHKGSFENLCNLNESIYERFSLEKRVTNKCPPAFIWHTSQDTCVPPQNSLLLALAYKKLNIPFELHIFEKGHHGLSLASLETYNVFPQVQNWVKLALAWLEKLGFEIID